MKKKIIYLLLLTLFFIPIGVYSEEINEEINTPEVISENSEDKDLKEDVNEDSEELLCNDKYNNKYKCKTPKEDNGKKVYDYANLLTDEEEQVLFSQIKEFVEKYNLDVALVTINENPYGVSDDYSRIYAQDFYYYNRFGKNASHDGFIILIDMSNRYVYIATKGNAMLVFDDDRIDNIIDYADNYLRNGNYFEAYKRMLDKALGYAKEGVAKSNEYYCIDSTGEPYKCKEKPKKVNWGASLIIGLLGSLIPAFIHTRKYRGVKLATNANTYLKDTNIDTKNDQFLTTFTSRTKINHDSGGSSHGGFGGSSTHHGSGGSFGGGGRHF